MALNLGARVLVYAPVGALNEWLHGRRLNAVDDDVHGRIGVRVMGGGVVWSMRQDVRMVCGHCEACRSLAAGTDCMRPMTAGDVDDLLIC